MTTNFDPHKPTLAEKEDILTDNDAMNKETVSGFNEISKAQHYNSNTIFSRECIEYVSHMSFMAGNAFKYLFRYKDKQFPSKDLFKACYYLERVSAADIGCFDKKIVKQMEQEHSSWVKSRDSVDGGGIDYFDSFIAETMIKLYSKEIYGEQAKNAAHVIRKYASILEKNDN